MNKSYSNKALPPGTVLREWRLEEVLGVGGFGIVYRGRGIYFDELVAIKEYFPSSISERKDGDTVVPIDSDAEEVHALGLKKFVEEAKLLWNLSTPTRHPNIVSVRSLFEIHGTAYMVMDFEDGVSLSKGLKDGRRFNQASLLGLVVPIAEGLERAHRVGVLHRDIKPPNILINEDGRPVLIDFGSARFESGEATSTTVTFHTPPYAAIEQYVKTYDQGPWTDVYALGVVLYECITGTKPPEVLERLHGGLGKPLAEGDWPGYSHAFLEAVDAAMTIRPTDRPQSVSEWLAMFDESKAKAPPPPASADETEDSVTRIYVAPAADKAIVPIAPPPPGFKEPSKVETPVPEDTRQVEFKRAGEDTDHSKTQRGAGQVEAQTGKEAGNAKAGKAPAASPAPSPKPSGSKRPLLIAAGAGALLLAGGGWYLSQQGGMLDAELANQTEGAPPAGGIPSVAPVVVSGAGDLAPALQALVAEARGARVSAQATNNLANAAAQLAQLHEGLKSLGSEAERTAKSGEMATLSRTATASFATALASEAAGRAQRVGREVPWADPRKPGAASSEVPERQRAASDLRNALASLNAAAAQARQAASPGDAINAARQALAASRVFSSAYYRAVRLNSSGAVAAETPATASAAPTTAPSEAPAPGKAVNDPAFRVPPAKLQQFNTSVASGRSLADNVIRQSRAAKSSGDAENSRAMDANIRAAQNYVNYLNTLANSMRGAKNEQEVERLITQAEQTRRYLTVLLSRASGGN